ncbi:MAG: hypothetical protein AVDCRST_MAG25-710, partial [uncultured Rubrobacteraceae bacterium]
GPRRHQRPRDEPLRHLELYPRHPGYLPRRPQRPLGRVRLLSPLLPHAHHAERYPRAADPSAV